MTFRERSFAPNAVLAWLLYVGPAAMAQTASSEENTSPAAAASQPAVSASVSAEGAPPPPESTPRVRAAEEEVVVTGSRIRRKDLTTAAPVTVINREAVQASGKVSI